jgi:hypothetical protein
MYSKNVVSSDVVGILTQTVYSEMIISSYKKESCAFWP